MRPTTAVESVKGELNDTLAKQNDTLRMIWTQCGGKPSALSAPSHRRLNGRNRNQRHGMNMQRWAIAALFALGSTARDGG